ncbi:hypothetical protein [Putridiphycobacter roseus]|uniref:hypothetical protein n=1 Tax=Putridiphycobacter roseus TaxID=2219161 RepID=UPI00131431AF|nr:hypothetical protein [Putridiphycobacter roseus]
MSRTFFDFNFNSIKRGFAPENQEIADLQLKVKNLMGMLRFKLALTIRKKCLEFK